MVEWWHGARLNAFACLCADLLPLPIVVEMHTQTISQWASVAINTILIWVSP